MLKKALYTLTLATSLSGSAYAAVSTGNIEVYDGSTLLGYVSKVYDTQNSFTYTANLANALNVQFDTSASLFAIEMLNSPGSASNKYFGAVGGSAGYNFSGNALGYTYFSGTALTAAGATPQFTTHDIQSLGYNAPAESTIWSLNGSYLNSVWVNTNGTVGAATLFYDPSVDFLGQVNSLATFTQTFPNEGAHAVSFRFTGNITPASPVPEPSTMALLALGLTVVAARGLRRGPSA